MGGGSASLVVPPLPKIPARYFVDPRDEVKWRKHHLTIERAIVMKKGATKSAEKM
jgi:hypothetical protein